MHSDHHLQNVSKRLCERLTQISDPKIMFAALRDLLTWPEIVEFVQRFDIASMLQEWVSYKDIEAKTGASSTTIARVSKYLKGPLGWYKALLVAAAKESWI